MLFFPNKHLINTKILKNSANLLQFQKRCDIITLYNNVK